MELVATPIGLTTLGIIATLYLTFARHMPLGALSLPCVSLLTTMVYYYVMPGLAFSGDDMGFLGVYIDSLGWVHWAAFLYALGVAAACFAGRRHMAINPATQRLHERPINTKAFWILAAVAAAGLVALTVTNRLNLTGSEEFLATEASRDFAFLQLSISMLIPLTIVYAIRENFGPRALAAIAAAALVFLVAGFRFRIAILMIAVAGTFCLTRGLKIGVVVVALGTTFALAMFNVIGYTRQYGVGLNLANLEGISWAELLRSFGGEVGPTFALFGVIKYPPADLIGSDPWILAIARLVPSFLWPNKPYPDYLFYYTIAFDERTRQTAGIAGPQQAEMLLQFGWPGLFVLPFIYFSIIILIGARLNRLSREARIAGAALLPGLFGFYMQQRGYFFQNLSEALFVIGPLFLMHFGTKSNARRLSGAPSAPRRRW